LDVEKVKIVEIYGKGKLCRFLLQCEANSAHFFITIILFFKVLGGSLLPKAKGLCSHARGFC